MRRFGAAIMRSPEASHFGVRFFLEDEDTVNHGKALLNLYLRQSMGDAPANVVRMTRLPLKDHPETNDGVGAGRVFREA
jgi:hypothetical protein